MNWQQTEFFLGSTQSEKCNYNKNLVQYINIWNLVFSVQREHFFFIVSRSIGFSTQRIFSWILLYQPVSDCIHHFLIDLEPNRLQFALELLNKIHEKFSSCSHLFFYMLSDALILSLFSWAVLSILKIWNILNECIIYTIKITEK